MDNTTPLTELRALLDLLMVCDPSPLGEAKDAAVRRLADRIAREHGYDGWVDAYHQVP